MWGDMVTIQRLLHERDNLLRRLTRLETRRAMGGRPAHTGSGSGWRFHRTMRPSPRCILTYVDAVLHALPALAWNDADRGRRESLLPELHDAYANEDLALLRALRAEAQDRPPSRLPEPIFRRRVRRHVAWLVDRVSELSRPEATGSA